MLFNNARFQTWAAKKVATKLSAAIGSKVEIRNVKISFFDRAVFEGFYVEDLHHDTLLYVDELIADFDDVYLNFTHFDFDKVVLKKGQFNVRQFQGEDDLNIQFILDIINGPKDPNDTTKYTPPELFFWKVDVQDVDFTYEYRDSIPDTAAGFNVDHIRINNIYAELNRLMVIDDSLSGEIRGMRGIEASGLELKEMNTDFVISYTQMDFVNLVAKTPRSNVSGNFHFEYGSYKRLSNFVAAANMKVRLKRSSLNLDELSVFSSDLKGFDQQAYLSGDFTGTVDHLKSKNFLLEFGRHSRMAGSFKMDGLPETDSTYFAINFSEFRTNKKDIEKLQQYPFTSGKLIELPPLTANLGTIIFKGRLVGVLDNLAAEGEFKTGLGEVITDISLRYNEDMQDYIYEGFLSTPDFDLGQLVTMKPSVGKIAFDAVIKGESFDPNKLLANVNGTVQKIELNGYPYQNITLQGEFAKNVYDGTMKVMDPNLRLNFKGLADLSQKQPVFDFQASLDRLDFTALKILKRDSAFVLSTEISSRFTGKNLDELHGRIELANSTMTYGTSKYRMEDLLLEAEGLPEARTIKLYSDMADASVSGAFRLASLPDAVSRVLNSFLPSFTMIKVNEKNRFDQNFDYSLKIKDVNLLSKLFFPGIEVSKGSSVAGNFSSEENIIRMNIISPVFKVSGVTFYDVKSTAHARNHKLSFSSESRRMLITDSVFIDHVKLSSDAVTDALDLQLRWASKSSLSDADAQINARALFRNKTIEMKILPSLILIEDTLWQVNAENSIVIEQDNIQFENLSFIHLNEFIRIDGKMSKSPVDELDVILDNFQLRNVNPFISDLGIDLDGSVKGIISLEDVFKNPYFKSNLDFKSIKVNNDLIGDGQLTSKWEPQSKKILVDGLIGTREFPKVAFTGSYIPSKQEDNLDLQLALSNIRLELFKPYVADIFSDVSGLLDGNLHLTGSPQQLVTNGELSFDKRTFFTVDILNTRYQLLDKVQIRKNLIQGKNMLLRDMNQNTARMDLKITHKYFNDFYFDLNIDANKIQALNTTEDMNDLFYGTAYATGNFRAYGPVDNLVMDISAKTEKGTVLNLPLTGTSEVNQQDFIIFSSKANPKKQAGAKKKVVENKGYELNFNLEVTPDAEVRLLFDPKVGDMITGNGAGDLRMEVTEAGEFYVYGDYIIDGGNYLFTLQNVINKPFVIQKGGIISFTGDPYDADINLSAVYKVKTPLYNLVKHTADSNNASVKRPIDVDAVMKLTDKLMKPQVRFDIQLPNSDETARNLLRSQIVNEDELNRQVFALILFRSFWPSQGGGASEATGGVGSNATELLSSQLTNMLSQISDDVNIGVNYNQGNATSGEQISVNLSTQFFNDRVLIGGNLGTVGNTQSAQNTSNMVGEFNIEVKVTEDGTVRVIVFNRSNQYLILTNDVRDTQGVGLFYRREFDVLSDLKKDKKRKRSKEAENVAPGIQR